uniref:Aspartyl/asparaginy/proline hydroxylase domain-containing protein n=1 Tax=Romanomermis culicivorax TaxID=13658 RepID=A0A915JN52_ROMCU
MIILGRVGDSCIVGAGFYADKNVAVTGTGNGDVFVKKQTCVRVAQLLATNESLTLDQACRQILDEYMQECGAGLIAVDSRGQISMVFNTSDMYRGYAMGENEVEMIEWLLSFVFPKAEIRDNSTCKSENCIRCAKNEVFMKEAESKFDDFMTNNNTPDQFQRIAVGFDPITKNNDHLFYINELTSRAIWENDDLPLYCLSILTENVDIIRDELFEQLNENRNGWFKDRLNRDHYWKKFYFMNQGTWVVENAKKCPKTMRIVQSLPKLMKNCAFGYVFWSILEPNCSIEKHRGPTNLRLRCHLPLQVPEPEKSTHCCLTVDDRNVEWTSGKCLIFDDSFEHSVRFESEKRKFVNSRIVLIIDLWHPDLSEYEIALLCKLFPSNSEN